MTCHFDEAGDALSLFLPKVGFDGMAVCFAMALEHDAGGGFEFGGLVFKVGTGAAFLLAGVAGQLDPVDSEHLASDQPLARRETNAAIVVKCGWVSPDRAIKVT